MPNGVEIIEKRDPPDNNWSEWQRYVLMELHRIGNDQKEVVEKITNLRVEVGKLQVKSGFWGAIGGIVSVGTIVLVQFVARAVTK